MEQRNASTPLLGREAQTRMLEDVLSAAAAGTGRGVLLLGEAGIGKSALLADCAAKARARGFAVLRGAADEWEREFPLWPFLDLLGTSEDDRAAVTSLLRSTGGGATSPVHAAAERLFQIVEQRCAATPVLLVMDDLQWADDASAALWGRLVRHAEQLPLVVAGAARSGADRAVLEPVLNVLERSDGLVLPLPPLDEGDLAALAAVLLAAPAGPSLRRELARTGGNPLYAAEVLALLRRKNAMSVGPDGVDLLPGHEVIAPAAAISDRTQRLSSGAREVLRAATVLGMEFRPGDLAAVLDRSLVVMLPLIEEAASAEILVATADRLAFRHHLIWEALTETIPGALRGAMHRHVARTLDRVGAADDEVATQLMRADGLEADDWAVTWIADHARELVDRSPQVAARLLEQALRAPAPPAPTALTLRLIEALLGSGRGPEAETSARAVIGGLGTDPDAVAEASWLLAEALNRTRSLSDGFTESVEVLRAAMGLEGVSERAAARLAAQSAFHLHWAGHEDEAAAAAAAGMTLGGRTGDDHAVAAASWVTAQMSRSLGDYTRAMAAVDLGLEHCADGARTRDEANLRVQRLKMLTSLGRSGEAKAEVLRLQQVRDRLPGIHASSSVAIADHRFMAGDWDDALAEIEFLSEDAYQVIAVSWHGLAALVRAHQDDRARCEEHLRATRDQKLDEVVDIGAADWLLMARAVVAEQGGRTEEALAALQKALIPELADHVTEGPEWMPVVVRLALAVNDRGAAEAAAGFRPPGPQEQSTERWRQAAAYGRGLLAADPEPVLAAAEFYAALGRPLRQGMALEDAAELLARQGESAQAKRRLNQAVEVYTRLGARWDIRRAETRLRACGIRQGVRGPRARVTSGWESLTPTELLVAERVAAGLSNPDIAAELLLSPRTVQTHVSHILAKLTVRSRVDIAREAARRGA
ncbi:ATP-binding protein [Kitasatospora paracochleata]|uniref:DNA-binding CsgD family transcriptional regulator n=3 Tax=Kitasatospora paracochleata TaxID=58354 RepID=A0ABT1J2E0_9ACTN|nr:LuxR family transcriptional regulator [Kitasatospora paracochleata]MCP2311605.1 DNA-binding CsgD family transcriptional regulator [Kitasatospora paracochleata]